MWKETIGCIWKGESRANIINMTSITRTEVGEKVTEEDTEKDTAGIMIRIKSL
jgi:hypothetical protein